MRIAVGAEPLTAIVETYAYRLACERVYDMSGMNRDIDVVMNVVCRIEVDGSLLCGSARLAGPVAGNAPAARVIELSLHFRNY